jgi:hypothetical protein
LDFRELYKLFQGNYEKKYHAIIEGNENFCDELLDGNLVREFKDSVVGQDHVIDRLGEMFDLKGRFIVAGFAGAHGTGEFLEAINLNFL